MNLLSRNDGQSERTFLTCSCTTTSCVYSCLLLALALHATQHVQDKRIVLDCQQATRPIPMGGVVWQARPESCGGGEGGENTRAAGAVAVDGLGSSRMFEGYRQMAAQDCCAASPRVAKCQVRLGPNIPNHAASTTTGLLFCEFLLKGSVLCMPVAEP
jgi:hypothetical protein